MAPFNINDLTAKITNFRWPQSTDKLIGKGGSRSDLGGNAWSRQVVIGAGYIEAANLLVDAAGKDIYHGRILLYPVLFLYRHALELDLKYTIETYGRFAGEKPNLQDHDLVSLWRSVHKVLKHFGSNDPADANVERLVAEFSKLDPNSVSFRYARDNKGKDIALGTEPVNLREFRDVMQGVHNFFEGTDGYLDNCVRNIASFN